MNVSSRAIGAKFTEDIRTSFAKVGRKGILTNHDIDIISKLELYPELQRCLDRITVVKT